MSSKLALLLKRLEAVTARYGSKADLARFLGVPQSRVREWMAGVYEPGAETTLSILEWVQGEEAKQQNESRGSALTPPRPKTRKRESVYEKRKRVRKKQ